jgi:hypothetical protein
MENYNKVDKNELKTYYYLNDKLHRLDGPAIEYSNGGKEWFQNGLLHRLDGPAIICYNGDKGWYQNGKLHRINGPAIEYYNGHKYWWFEGEYTYCNSQEEFERYIKLRLFW